MAIIDNDQEAFVVWVEVEDDERTVTLFPCTVVASSHDGKGYRIRLQSGFEYLRAVAWVFESRIEALKQAARVVGLLRRDGHRARFESQPRPATPKVA